MIRDSLRRIAAIAGLLAVLWFPLAGVVQADGGQTGGQQPVGPQPPVAMRDVGFDPHLDAQLPLDLTFNDENGRPVQLTDYFTTRPVLLTLNDFTCQDLCPIELNNLVDTMNQLPFRLGVEYTALSISFNPSNAPADAGAMRATILQHYVASSGSAGAPGPAAGWHFLTGQSPAIAQLTQAVGFRYAYDPQIKDYAHPIGAILLTPGGRIARYLYGMDFPPKDLRLALDEASQSKISTPVDALLLLCYHYNPTTGRYSATALNVMRAGGILTVLALGSLIGGLLRRELRDRRQPPPGSAG